MPRRKYGHMVGTCQPVPVEKCNLCCIGYPCPVHKSEKKPDYKMLTKKKRKRYSGSKKEKKRMKKVVRAQ